MFLAIDIGNTDAVLGFFEGKTLKFVHRIKSLRDENQVYFEYRIRDFLLENEISGENIRRIVISSVVPPLTPIFTAIAQALNFKEPLLVTPHSFPPVFASIDNPDELGSDLYANAVAAYSKYKKTCLIVDFGTALTFTVIAHNGEIKGVAITAGLKTTINSLFSKTAQLPVVPLERPKSVLGKNTIHAIQAGVMVGFESLVRGMLTHFKTELANDKPIIIATGGLSSVLTNLHPEFDEVNINLTLEGIRLIGEN